MLGRPANRVLLETIESLKTMKRPPMTLRLRRKKFMSKMRPYPNPWITTTDSRPPTANSVYFLEMTAPEAISIVFQKNQETCPSWQVGTYDNVNNEEEVRKAPWEMTMSVKELGVNDVWNYITHCWRYQIWSLHWVTIRKASSKKVTTIRKRPIAGKWGFNGCE